MACHRSPFLFRNPSCSYNHLTPEMSALRENPRVKFVIGLATSVNVGNFPKFNCGLLHIVGDVFPQPFFSIHLSWWGWLNLCAFCSPHWKNVGQASSHNGMDSSTFRRSWGCLRLLNISHQQSMKNCGKTSSCPMLKSRPQSGVRLFVASQNQVPRWAAPVPTCPMLWKPLGMIPFKREIKPLVFYSWILLSLSLPAKLR